MIVAAKPLIGDEECRAVEAVLRSSSLAQGSEVARFEEEFSGLVEGRSCIAVSSGTAALHIGLLAAGIGPGDEVIVPSFTFAATANAVRLAGAVPVFVDIEPSSFCIDPAAAAAAVTPRTAAIVPVHLYGHPARMRDICDIARRNGLLVLEDAAQAHAARLDGRPVGTWGAAAAFSFYPTKNMTTGEGGMIVTTDPHLARTARLLRNQGMAERYRNEIVGFNARMTDIAAAIGRVQLSRLAGWTALRQAIAAVYDERLGGVVTPTRAAGAVHVYHQYTIRHPERDALLAKLRAHEVGAGIYYPVPVHRLPAFDCPLDLPVTARAVNEVLSLPMGPHLTRSDVSTVVAAVNA